MDENDATAAVGATDDADASVDVPGIGGPAGAGIISDTVERRRISSVRERDAGGGGGGAVCFGGHFEFDFCEWASTTPLVAVVIVVIAFAVAVAP